MYARAVDTLEVTYRCRLCGEIAAVVAYVPSGTADPQHFSVDAPPGIETIGLDQPRISIRGGPAPATFTLGEDNARVVESAVRAGSAKTLYKRNREWAPFWCRQCGGAYCRDHWHLTPVFDEAEFDYLDGACPQGHRRIISD
jgi:hypothetical protein